jgi:putative flavoprotein involved in K+ transport
MPFDINGRMARLVDPFFWFALNHVLTTRTPMGRRARPFVRMHGGPLERVRNKDLAEAGIKRVVGRAVGASAGLPMLEDGQILPVHNLVWATGFRHEYPWIQLPVIGEDGWPIHERGVATSVPGIYFVGLPFQFAVASSLIGGVGRDARYVVDRIVAATQ